VKTNDLGLISSRCAGNPSRYSRLLQDVIQKLQEVK